MQPKAGLTTRPFLFPPTTMSGVPDMTQEGPMQYVCLYSGLRPESARLVAKTGNPAAIRAVAEVLLDSIPTTKDPVLRRLNAGRRDALREVIKRGRMVAAT